MARPYSASPARRSSPAAARTVSRTSMPAATGGCITVADAMRHSVNLVFIRLMRDIVRYRMRERGSRAAAMLSDHARSAAPRAIWCVRRPGGEHFLRRVHSAARGIGAR